LTCFVRLSYENPDYYVNIGFLMKIDLIVLNMANPDPFLVGFVTTGLLVIKKAKVEVKHSRLAS
jgi:hypothetical protein